MSSALIIAFSAAGLFVIAFWVMFALASRRSRIHRRLFKEIALNVPSKARRGTALPVRLQFTVTRDVEIDGVTATLRARKGLRHDRSVTSITGEKGYGESQIRYTVVFESSLALSGPITAQAGRRFDLDGSITIPEDAPKTMTEAEQRFEWSLETRIAFASVPDWTQKRRIGVR